MHTKIGALILTVFLCLAVGHLAIADAASGTADFVYFSSGWSPEGVLLCMYEDGELPTACDLMDMGDLSDTYGVMEALKQASFTRDGNTSVRTFDAMQPKATLMILLRNPAEPDEALYVSDPTRSFTITAYEGTEILLITMPTTMQVLDGRGYLTEAYTADSKFQTFLVTLIASVGQDMMGIGELVSDAVNQ